MSEAETVVDTGGDRPRRPDQRRSRWRWRVLMGFAVLLVLSAVPTVWERWVAASYLRDEASAPAIPVGIVFGALVVDNRPTAFLASRLDLALRLYRAGKIKVIVVSGHDDGHGYDEPDVMRDYLVARGVPDARIVVDRAGIDTWNTCARARQVYGVDQALLITQSFHVSRAVALCRANGVDGYGVGIESWSVGVNSTVYGYFREYFAAYKAMWNALVAKPAPQVPGPPSDAVAKALR